MTITLENNNGYIEAKLTSKSESVDFYSIAEIIANKLKCSFGKKIDDFDSLYWEFEFKKSLFILHYNNYLGISIYPQSTFKSSKEEEIKLKELVVKLTGP